MDVVEPLSGVGSNIPNDNLCELHVQLVKKKIKEQGGIFTWVDQKVLKLVAYLHKYTTELHQIYTEYVTTIS